MSTKLEQIRQLMRDRKIKAYIIQTSDPHQSEYLADYYKTREFVSGFTGSQGTLVITEDKAGLWTDSRYFLQAEKELAFSGIDLYKMGVEGYPTYEQFLIKEVNEYEKIAFDGTCFSIDKYKSLSKNMGDRMLLPNVDLISEIWQNRPALPKEKIWIYDTVYTGESMESKIKRLRKIMENKNYDYTFIGAPEDICYLLNLRGNDVEYNPVFLSYLLVSHEEIHLCVDNDKLTSEVLSYLDENGVKVHSYEHIFQLMKKIPGTNRIFLDPLRTNVKIYDSINSNVRIITGTNISTKMKSIKNEVEIENIKKAYEIDCATLIKFFNWVETGAITGSLTESLASKRLREFRRENKEYIEDSFETIAGYKENAAIVHYSPTKNISKTLNNEGLFLVDSGAHYIYGTTDITRTIALGQLTEEEKNDYTLVLKSHIMLSEFTFKEHTTGDRLDQISKYHYWKNKKDFFHGTGHGVGFSLTVHEGPQAIALNNKIGFVENMTCTIEPGLYIANSHGIRLENEVYTTLSEENEFGKFLKFEKFTYIPFDTRAINFDMLEQWEIDWLNDYHKKCYDILSDSLEGGDLEYLKDRCEKIEI